MRNRNVAFTVRLSEKEKQQLERIIKKCGLTKSAFVRLIINQYIPKEKPPPQYYSMIKELNAIGNNFNQIATVANSTGMIDKLYYDEQVILLDRAILELNKMTVLPERIDKKWLQQKSGALKVDLIL